MSSNLIDTPEMKLKRMCLRVDSSVKSEIIQNMIDELIEDGRLVELLSLFSIKDNIYYLYLEYDIPRRIKTILNQINQIVVVDKLMIRKMKCEKKVLINAFIRMGMTQKELPLYLQEMVLIWRNFFEKGLLRFSTHFRSIVSIYSNVIGIFYLFRSICGSNSDLEYFNENTNILFLL
jgi:hypothetical protein